MQGLPNIIVSASYLELLFSEEKSIDLHNSQSKYMYTISRIFVSCEMMSLVNDCDCRYADVG